MRPDLNQVKAVLIVWFRYQYKKTPELVLMVSLINIGI